MYNVETKFVTLSTPGWVRVGTHENLDDAVAMADKIYVRTARVVMDGREVYRNDI